MLPQQTLSQLRQLKLHGMAEAFERQLAQPDTHDLPFEQRLGLLVDGELLSRDQRRLTRLLQAARLKHNACLEDINYRHPRGLKRPQIAALASGDWIRQHHNLIFTGPTGSGKSYLACALGQQACRQGFSTLYERTARLLDTLHIARGDGSYAKRMAKLAKTDVLILDDWGLNKLARMQAQDLLELIEDRHTSRSTVITSQLPIDQWHDYIGDPTLADAILDRLVHNAYKLPLTGESMRKRQSPIDGS